MSIFDNRHTPRFHLQHPGGPGQLWINYDGLKKAQTFQPAVLWIGQKTSISAPCPDNDALVFMHKKERLLNSHLATLPVITIEVDETDLKTGLSVCRNKLENSINVEASYMKPNNLFSLGICEVMFKIELSVTFSSLSKRATWTKGQCMDLSFSPLPSGDCFQAEGMLHTELAVHDRNEAESIVETLLLPFRCCISTAQRIEKNGNPFNMENPHIEPFGWHAVCIYDSNKETDCGEKAVFTIFVNGSILWLSSSQPLTSATTNNIFPGNCEHSSDSPIPLPQRSVHRLPSTGKLKWKMTKRQSRGMEYTEQQQEETTLSESALSEANSASGRNPVNNSNGLPSASDNETVSSSQSGPANQDFGNPSSFTQGENSGLASTSDNETALPPLSGPANQDFGNPPRFTQGENSGLEQDPPVILPEEPSGIQSGSNAEPVGLMVENPLVDQDNTIIEIQPKKSKIEPMEEIEEEEEEGEGEDEEEGEEEIIEEKENEQFRQLNALIKTITLLKSSLNQIKKKPLRKGKRKEKRKEKRKRRRRRGDY